LIPYFFLLLSVCFIENLKKKFKNYRIFNFSLSLAIFLSLSLFAGLRASQVGTDTNGYLNSFFYYNSNSLNEVFTSQSTVEIGYRILQYFLKLLTNKDYVFLTFMSAFVLFFQLRAIRLLSKNNLVSIFVFICFGIYTFSFNGLRQGIAAAVFMFSFYFILNKKFYHFLALIIFGSLFHKSILVVIPFYFLFLKKFNSKLIFVLLLGSIILSLGISRMLLFSSILNDRYATYIDFTSSGGFNLSFFYILTSIFFVFYRKFIQKSLIAEYDVFLNSYLLGSIIFCVVVFTGTYIEITRVSFYFTITQLFLWPLLLKSTHTRYLPVLKLSMIILGIIYFYFILSEIGGLIPYYISKEI